MSEIERRIETGDINGPEEAGDATGPRGGAEKLLIIPVNEDSRKITQTLSNETSLKILELLGKKKLSASDIAGELKIPLTTVKYNIDSLVDSDLVQVKQIKWSRKGRQVKIYEAMEKLIVLVPSKAFADKISIISMLQQYIGVIAGAFFAAAGIEYLTAYLRARRLINVVSWGPPAGLPALDYAAPETALAPAPESMLAAVNTSENGLSPKMTESPELMADYNVFDKDGISANEGLNEVFAGDVEEELAEEVARDMVAEAPVGEASMEEVPMEEEMSAAEAPEAPEMLEAAPVSTEDALPLEDTLEGMDTSALDSVPPGTLGAGAVHHFFDTLLAHPGVWFFFGCLFVIFFMIVREVYYKKKSM